MEYIKKEKNKFNFNKGTFLKYPIIEFINSFNNQKTLKISDSIHCLGLTNIRASIYMNPTLQCLCNVTSLKNYFQNPNLVSKDINNRQAPLTKSFYELLNKLWTKTYEKYYSPNNFKNTITNLNPLFKWIKRFNYFYIWNIT